MEKWKTETKTKKQKKRICSEVSVKSPGNPWSQSRIRNGRLRWEVFAEKEGLNLARHLFTTTEIKMEKIDVNVLSGLNVIIERALLLKQTEH